MCCWVSNPKKVITIAWLLSLVLVFCAFIIACVAASKMAGATTNSTPAAFACIWTCLVLIVLSVLGFSVERQEISQLPVVSEESGCAW